MMPAGTVIIDERHRSEREGDRVVADAVGELSAGIHHWGLVARCAGPKTLAWTVVTIEVADQQSGDMACDGVAHGTGIVTRSEKPVPVTLTYSAAADFRFVLVLIAP